MGGLPPETYIVVPCYNEAARFPAAVFRQFWTTHPGIAFVLVNDGSRDATLSVLEQARAGFEGQVSVLNQPRNGGKGEAVRAGMQWALSQPGARAAGFWDADLATPLDAILDLLAILDHHPSIQMIFGARVNLLGRKIHRRALRHYLGRIFATTVSVVLNLQVYDTQCGAKLFRNTPAIASLWAEPFSSRWVFDVELIARWIRAHQMDRAPVRASIFEFPLHQWEDVAGSKVRPHDFFRAFLDVAAIYRRYLAPRP